MIQIVKPEAPEILKTKGKSKQAELCAAFDEGVREFEFDEEKIYNHAFVKKTLTEAQYKKCCYCERKVSPNSSDVEHFRPKTACQQSFGEKLTKPAYYWLAFEWNNLFLSCADCNRSYKKNLFPLANPKDRVNSHNENLNQEESLLIHPENENPEDFIAFRGSIVYSIEDNKRGNTTIKVTGLDRVELEERRRVSIEILKSLYDVATKTPELPTSKRAMEKLKKCALKENEFSSMVKANLNDGFEFA